MAVKKSKSMDRMPARKMPEGFKMTVAKKPTPKAKNEGQATGEFQMFVPPYLQDEESDKEVTPSDTRTARRDKSRQE
jgi:hypothetical protein